MPEPLLLAVTGKPVAHSLSPDIFGLLFAAAGVDGRYTRLAADTAGEALATARAIGCRGLNVTSPFKEEMLALVDEADEHARKIGAVNCVVLDGRRSIGHNTDFMGVTGALGSLGLEPAGRAALVLGTGGAARAAAYGLIGAGAVKVTLAGRSLEKARAAAEAIGGEWASIDEAGRLLEKAAVCVSCLPFPASRLLGGPPPGGCLLLDAHYASASRPADPRQASVPAAHRWLFHQAVPSFEIFTGLAVRDRVRQEVFQEFAARRAPARRDLALVGFMGAGKTTIGRTLAELLGWEFVDTDEAIVAAAGLSIPEIFRLHGENDFRTRERKVLERTMAADGGPRVIAVGGGAVLDEDNRRLLATDCRVVWLWAPVETSLARVEVATRPVLDPDRPRESAERTLAARRHLYASVADLIVNAAADGPLAAARRIQDEMGQAL